MWLIPLVVTLEKPVWNRASIAVSASIRTVPKSVMVRPFPTVRSVQQGDWVQACD